MTFLPVANPLLAHHGRQSGPDEETYIVGTTGEHTRALTAVRRLTPRECERLQGFPDDWTLLPDGTADSRRYAALGDAVTVNVARWIGQRLAAVHARYAEQDEAA